MRATEDLEALAGEIHGAAGAVHEGNDAVDGRIIVEYPGTVDGLGHELGHRRGAIHAGEDAEIVAGANLAVGAPETFERGPLGLGHEVCSRRAGRKVVVALEGTVLRPHVAVVLVHPIARGDRLAGEADDLPELDHRLAGGDIARSELVAEGNALSRLDPFRGYRIFLDAFTGNENVVLGAETQCAGGGDGMHGGSSKLARNIVLAASYLPRWVRSINRDRCHICRTIASIQAVIAPVPNGQYGKPT